MFLKNLIFKFTILLSNESNIHEILPYDYSIFLFFKEIIIYQKILIHIENLFFYFDNLFFIVKSSEINRFENMIRLYHIDRVWKIESNIVFLNKKYTKYHRFNIEEKKYIQSYRILCRNFIKIQFLNFIPNEIKSIIRQDNKFHKNKIKLKTHTCVCFKLIRKNTRRGVIFITDLKKIHRNKIYSTKYKKVKHFLCSCVCVCL